MDNQSENNQTTESASIELTEADFCNPELREAAVQSLIGSLEQPQERVLVRPRISAIGAILNVFIPLCICAATFCLLFFLLPKYNLVCGLSVSLGLLGVYFLIRLRDFCIWCIMVYQRFAPDETRLRCVFTPSCSEYAILALKKYGFIRGLPKIISRLKRCHPPNGGNDELK